ncbi:hypothetical protein BH11BAC3_BH11BAC3_08160 [soil metagenome]
MTTVNCKNCDNIFDGKFCPQCGQAASTHRVNALYFLHDIPHSVLHVDKGFPYTFYQLIKRPARALDEYLAGRRVSYDRPFSYVLIMSAISVLIVSRIRNYMQELQQHNGNALHDASFFSHYQAVFLFLLIPLSGAITWLVFRKNKYNFWEHILINTYLAAQLNVLLVIINVFSLLKYLITGSAGYSVTVFMTGFMVYYALTFSGLMNATEKGFTLGIKLGVMCFLLASVYITAMIFAGIVTV